MQQNVLFITENHLENAIISKKNHSYEMDILVEALVSSIRNLKRMLH